MLISGWRLYVPIIFFFSYLTGTVLLFEFGPWPWPVTNKSSLYTYLLLAHFSLALGYVTYARVKPKEKLPTSAFPARLIWYSLILSAILILPTSFARTGSVIPDFVAGLDDLGTVYEIAVEKSFGGQAGVWIEYCRIFLAPILAALLPLTFFYWREMRVRERIAAVTIFFLYGAIGIASGINKNVVDLALIVPCMIFAAVIAGKIHIDRKRLVVGLVLLIACGAGALTYFSNTQTARVYSGAAGGYFGPPLNIRSTVDLGANHWMDDGSIVLVESLARYVCAGYVTVAWSLEKEFTSTYGLGHSMTLARNADRLGLSFAIDDSYPGKLEADDGWGYYRLFHSIHTWIASDVSFLGALVIMYLIGYLFAQAWIDTISRQLPLAVINLAHFVQMLFYFPANNQVVQSPEPFVAFYVLLIAWQISRRQRSPVA